MKKIKVFSMVLALGLGLTATFAFKAHKNTLQFGVLDGSAVYSSGQVSFTYIDPAKIGAGLDYQCNSGTVYCELNYTGTYVGTPTNGSTITINASLISGVGTQSNQSLQEND